MTHNARFPDTNVYPQKKNTSQTFKKINVFSETKLSRIFELRFFYITQNNLLLISLLNVDE